MLDPTENPELAPVTEEIAPKVKADMGKFWLWVGLFYGSILVMIIIVIIAMLIKGK